MGSEVELPREETAFRCDAKSFSAGEEKGRHEGRAEGEAKGRVEGEVKGRAEALLLVLRSRGVDVSPELEQRILACADPAVLAAWLQRAATVTSTAELMAS